MKTKLLFLSALFILAASISACSMLGGEPSLSNLRMAFDEYGEDVTTAFSPSDVIYAVVDVENAPLGTVIAAKWYAVNVEGEEPDLLFQEQMLTTSDDNFSGTLYFQLANDADWPPGLYKVELYLDGVLAQSIEFKIE